jgi:hypothetical protein
MSKHLFERQEYFKKSEQLIGNVVEENEKYKK